MILEIITILAGINQPSLDRAEINCLAEAIAYESRDQPDSCQIAVGQVVLSRAEESGRPICEVVYAPKQFSWTAHPKPELTQDERRHSAWLAVRLSTESLRDQSRGATHFYDYRKVSPGWASSMRETRKCAAHRFMQEKSK